MPTAYKGYATPATGTLSGVWGDTINTEMMEPIDRNLGGIVAKSLTSSNVTLTAEESQNLIVRLTGTLSADVEVETAAQGVQIVENLTSGSFSVTFTDGNAGVVIPQGSRAVVIMDSSNGARIAASEFPSGTVMLFNQTSSPTGWTKNTSTGNDTALRLTTGTVGTGGSVAFETAFASKTPSGTVGNTTLTINQIPLHGHPWRSCDISVGTPSGSGGFARDTAGNTNNSAFTGTPSATDGQQIGGTGGGQSHTHSFTGNAINLDVAFCDVIRATKD